jgi:hypothetical protein
MLVHHNWPGKFQVNTNQLAGTLSRYTIGIGLGWRDLRLSQP